MSPRISQGCTLVLLLAMTLAMAAGMMAWGAITLTPMDHVFADQRSWLGIPSASNVLSCLPLFGVSAWGVRAVRTQVWPGTLSAPWLAFFVLSGLMTLAAAGHHVALTDATLVLTHGLAASAFVMLGLAFLAERIDALFGSIQAILGGLAVIGCAMLWWFAGEWTGGHGDLRALLFFEYLPLLLVPAGALSLPGRYTTVNDWTLMLCLYLLARTAGLADGPICTFTQGLSGHTLMHLLSAASAACIAYRASVVPGAASPRSASLDPTQRRTSLNTSS